jgi:hypothetical protein
LRHPSHFRTLISPFAYPSQISIVTACSARPQPRMIPLDAHALAAVIGVALY